jgi:hypothetical protein
MTMKQSAPLYALVWWLVFHSFCARAESLELRPTPAHNSQNVPERLVISDFSKGSKGSGWKIENDGVMGGVSQGRFLVTEQGVAIFSGEISLENNGGFSSVQYVFDPMDVTEYEAVLLRIKGDGKRYQFIVEATSGARHYYTYGFTTTGEWQTVRVPFAEMKPMSRGNPLRIPNYSGETMTMVRFLIGNNREESFQLLIESISLDQ